MKYWIICCFALTSFIHTCAQDTTVIWDNQKITLPDAVVKNNLDYKSILTRIKNDTTFYKAFRNLRIIEFTSYNDIRILNKDRSVKASWSSKTTQHRENDCRIMEVINQQTTGDYFDRKGNCNYTTGEMYASIFLTKNQVCGETNIVTGHAFDLKNKSGMEKHKEQLKMLFFDPGKKIPGIPFIGDKLDLYDEHAHKVYDYKLDFVDYKGSFAYVFTIKPKEDLGLFRKDDVVVDEMVTWFDYKSFEVLARNYALSYKVGVYDFDVNMQVEMTRVGDLLVPKTLRYKGDFSAIFKRRERGEFTATLFDFKR